MEPINAQMIKRLRELSGAPMTKCKNALVEANGNFEKALARLRDDDGSSASEPETTE